MSDEQLLTDAPQPDEPSSDAETVSGESAVSPETEAKPDEESAAEGQAELADEGTDQEEAAAEDEVEADESDAEAAAEDEAEADESGAEAAAEDEAEEDESGAEEEVETEDEDEEQDEDDAEGEDEEGEKAEEAELSNKRWYVVKVQSAREESIKEAIERRVKIEGLEEFFGQIVIPTEKVVEMRKDKRVVRDRKLYPGYLMVEVEYNDRILYLFRETTGVGDFVGGSIHTPPQPMPQSEVDKMLGKDREEKDPKVAAGKPKFDRGDRVKVKDGTFVGMEGEVKDLLEAKHMVRVELTVFGRSVPVDLEYWAVETI